MEVSIKSLPSEHRDSLRREGGKIVKAGGSEGHEENKAFESTKQGTYEITETEEASTDLYQDL